MEGEEEEELLVADGPTSLDLAGAASCCCRPHVKERRKVAVQFLEEKELP